MKKEEPGDVHTTNRQIRLTTSGTRRVRRVFLSIYTRRMKSSWQPAEEIGRREKNQRRTFFSQRKNKEPPAQYAEHSRPYTLQSAGEEAREQGGGIDEEPMNRQMERTEVVQPASAAGSVSAAACPAEPPRQQQWLIMASVK